jgi:hypothetical protein
MSSIGAVNTSGSTDTYGGPGQSKSVVEATLYQFAKQKAVTEAPLKIPDARELFAIGRRIDMLI